jgi:hypothetical protein
MVPTYLSAACGEAFQGQGVQDVEEFDSVDALFLFDGGWRRQGKKKRKRGERNNQRGRGFPRLNLSFWLCHGSQLFGAIKG